jgi:hypothetical protein
MLQIQDRAQRFARAVVAQAVVISAVATVTIGSPASQAVAALPAQGGNNACRVNGQVIVPTVDAAHVYGWAFAANFDHPASATTVTTCLAERYWPQKPWQTQYTIATSHCAVVNNIASPQIQLGNGVAPFDGNAYLSCALPVPATLPSLFWIRALATLPNASQGYTFLSGNGVASGISVTAQTGTSCGAPTPSLVTMNSQYLGFRFSHTAGPGCGSATEYGSRMIRESTATYSGWHKIGAIIYGPTTGSTNLTLPANFSFNIGATGQPYTLDWLLIDPTPAKGG